MAKLKIKTATVSRDAQEYILLSERDEKGKAIKDATVFKVRPLSKKQLANYQDSSSRMNVFNNTILLGNSANELELFRSNVVDIKNLLSEDDVVIPFKKDGMLVSDELIEMLPLEIISEVARHILEISVPSEKTMGK